MYGTYQIMMGDRGRLVVPAEVRDRAGLLEGDTLTLIETPGGFVLLTRDRLKDLVRADLSGLDLVAELLAERRAESAAEERAVNVLDSSALLAFLQGEEGAEVVEAALQAPSRCGTANWSEVAQKVRAHSGSWELSRALLLSYGIAIDPVVEADAEWAARRWRPGEGLSLADRLCLALGERLDADVWTADQSWGRGGRLRQIR